MLTAGAGDMVAEEGMVEVATAAAAIWEGAATWVAADTTMAGEATAAVVIMAEVAITVVMGLDTAWVMV